MISRQHRFHGHASLGAVYRHGHTVRDQLMAIRYSRNQRRTTYRAAVIVSRKVHKSAVQRNRIRRRLYEIIRLQEPAIAGPYDLVLTVFSEQIDALSADDLTRLVAKLLKNAGVLGHPSGRRGIVTSREETS